MIRRTVALAALAVLGCPGSPGSDAGPTDAGHLGPTAVAAASVTSGTAPLEVQLDAADSAAGDAPIASWTWDFGDGSAPVEGVDVSHLFLRDGTFDVTLTVIDEADRSDAASVTVTVAPEPCPSFAAGVQVGTVAHAEITEASGLAASRRNPGVLWTHNDSGDSARAFAMTTDGTHLGIFTLTGASAADWEDMALGPGPDPDTDYLYFADIGDNAATRGYIIVYRVPEPVVLPSAGDVGIVPLAGAVALEMAYPDEAHDAETLLCDPVTADLYVVTKAMSGFTQVFRYPFPHDEAARVTLEEVATLQFGTDPLLGGATTTAGDIAPLGNQVLIRTYGTAFVWIRPGGAALADAFSGAPCPVPLVFEIQGEAIAHAPDGRAYYSVREFSFSEITRFDRDD